MERFRTLVADTPELSVPRVHRDLTRKRVLAMDRSRALPIEELRSPGTSQQLRDRMGARLVGLMYRELFEFRFVQSDPNFANYFWLAEDDEIGLLDMGATREVSQRISDHYRTLFRAGAEHDAATLREAALAVGFFEPGERSDRVEGLLELLQMGCEPLSTPGVYDFGETDLPARMRELSVDLAFRRGFLQPPPPETLFLHRKLGGTFLLCARLRARIPVKQLLEEITG